ncbi:hypothetical protein CKM354_001013700 [Cercospora kikuchii]|uniref:Acyl-CoA thioesterase-like C-terminal domain-containing protein n=1 Tax=Cercospora kikuchii TaxID=84275 RepID=A0A9P3CQU1_9PEZI|nr:uncharacterized protein CKM354_001013700 [Cercospora kikuchii]GIZ47036.1 hypothetical protein CKM354_001013700 [Cercospora kikuchii]
MADQYEFERSVSVKPVDGKPNHFTSVYRPWSWPLVKRAAGSVPMTEGTAAAYKTVPSGFELHCAQVQFLKAGKNEALRYKVVELMTTSNFASRNVFVTQDSDSDYKCVLLLSFQKRPLTSRGWPSQYEYTRPPSQEAIDLAGRLIEDHSPDLKMLPLGVPEGTPNPPFICQRLHTTQESDPNLRTYRTQYRITSPISSPSGQILAIMFLSDVFILDVPLIVHSVPFGPPMLGDETMTPTPSRVRSFASLTHTVRFARLEGFDVHQGVLCEMQLRWTKGRRALDTMYMRDCKGELIATVDQEAYFVFKTEKEFEKDAKAFKSLSVEQIAEARRSRL